MCNEQTIGNFIAGIAGLKAVVTYSCTCGSSYTMEWKMPTNSELIRAASGYSMGEACYIQVTTSASR